MIEVINDPRGRTTVEQTDIDTTDPTRPPHYRDVKTTTSNAFRFSLMFAKRIGPFTGRFGILESTGGIGLDTHLLRDRFEIRQVVFGFGETLQPRWCIGSVTSFCTICGCSPASTKCSTQAGVTSSWVQLRFNDQDLKSMPPFTLVRP